MRRRHFLAAIVGFARPLQPLYAVPRANRISFETTIDSAGGSGHLMTRAGLPGGGALAADVHFGVETRRPDRVSYKGPERLRKNVFYGAHWVDYAHARGGLTMIGTTGEKGYEWFPDGPALGHFLLMTIPPATNWERFVARARAGTGSHTFDYHLLLHAGGSQEANVPRRALGAINPLAPVAPERLASADARRLPERLSFVRIEPDTVQISAIAREGGSWRLRFFECAGTPTRASLTLPFAIASAAEVDFHGDPMPRIVRFSGRTLTLDLKTWEIVTLNVK